MSPDVVGPAQILLVEDNPGDARLAQEAFKEATVPNRIHVAVDGVDAMDFLCRRGKHRDAPRPDLILLDLNLPRKDGREVLAEVKRDPALMSIPIVVLTTSQAETDILKAYDLHANCYITKPLGLVHFLEVVKAVEKFWLSTVRLPSR